MARFKNKDLHILQDEELLFGDAQEASMWFDGITFWTNQFLKHETAGYFATQDYVDTVLRGLEWQDSVLSRVTDIPAGVYGERYIIPTGATGAWSGLDDTIAEYTTTWVYTTPSAGFATWVEDEGIYVIYNGSAWVRLGTVVDHGQLGGLADDDHTQYFNAARHDTTAAHGSSVVDHGLIAGLDDDDHAQYFLADGTRDLTGTLTISGDAGYISKIDATSVTDIFCDPDNVVASSGLNIWVDGVVGASKVFAIAADTCAIYTNLIIGDHYLQIIGDEGQDGFIYLYADDGDESPDWWRLRAGNDGLFAIQNYGAAWEDAIYIDGDSNLTVTGDVSAASFYGDGTRITGLITDHSELTGLSDDDHPIYLPSDGSRAMTGTLTVNTTGGFMRFSGLSADIGLAVNPDLISLNTNLVTIDGDLLADDLTLTDNINISGDISVTGQYVEGDVLSTAAGVVTLPGQSNCRVYSSTTQLTSASAWHKIIFDTEGWDIQNEFDTATNRFTANESGYYTVTLCVQISAAASDEWHTVGVAKNGTIVSTGIVSHTNTSVTTTYRMLAVDVVYLNGTTDYIDGRFWSSVANDVIVAASVGTNMSIHKVS